MKPPQREIFQKILLDRGFVIDSFEAEDQAFCMKRSFDSLSLTWIDWDDDEMPKDSAVLDWNDETFMDSSVTIVDTDNPVWFASVVDATVIFLTFLQRGDEHALLVAPEGAGGRR